MVEQRARPHSAPEHAQALRQVARHRPHALCVGATARRVEEVSLENVLVAACKRLLLLCLHGSQVHVGIKFADFLHHAALESLIPGHLVEWVHFISADGHDGGLTIDLANSVAESIELSNVFTFEAREVRLLESRSVATAVFGDDDVCVLAAEEHLHLLENLFQGEASCGQLTEDVVDISAPEEAALRAALLSLEVSADSDEVVVLKTCNGKVRPCANLPVILPQSSVCSKHIDCCSTSSASSIWSLSSMLRVTFPAAAKCLICSCKVQASIFNLLIIYFTNG